MESKKLRGGSQTKRKKNVESLGGERTQGRQLGSVSRIMPRGTTEHQGMGVTWLLLTAKKFGGVTVSFPSPT